jgi:hypothetical protein
MNHTKFISATVFLLLLVASAACERKPVVSEFLPTASVQEIMHSIIDPNIDFVWNSVASVSTKKGTEDRRPKTDEDWQQVKQHALVVLEASNLLLIEGRPVATPGASTSADKVELGPDEIQKLIEANRADFVQYAHALHATVSQTIAAIDAKDAEGLIEYGSAIDHVCEGCHKQFWYPNDKRPTSVPVK